MAGPYNITLQVQIQTSNMGPQLSKVNNQLNGLGKSTGLNNLASQGARAENALKSLNATVDISGGFFKNMASQVGQAARRFIGYTIAAGAVQKITGQFGDGVGAAIAFEKAMNRVAQVSSEPTTAIRDLSNEITNLSVNLGVSSQSLSEVALSLKQAGFSVKETQAAIEALAASDLSPTFESMAETGEGLIAARAQFKITADQYKATLGSINSVSAAYAVESKDLIEAIKRSGGAFVSAAGDFQKPQDSLNEFISLFTSVRATTRESADSIATGLRTIFTRLQRGQTVDALKELNIELRHTEQSAKNAGNSNLEGQFVGAFEAVKRLSEGLAGLRTTDARYSQVVEELGGYRQVSRVIPLLQQFALAQNSVTIAQAGTVSLTAAAERAQETFANKLDKTKEIYLALTRSLFDSKGFQIILDSVLKATNSVAKLVETFQSLIPVLAAVGAAKGLQALNTLGRGFLGLPSPKGGGGGSGGPGGGSGPSSPPIGPQYLPPSVPRVSKRDGREKTVAVSPLFQGGNASIPPPPKFATRDEYDKARAAAELNKLNLAQIGQTREIRQRALIKARKSIERDIANPNKSLQPLPPNATPIQKEERALLVTRRTNKITTRLSKELQERRAEAAQKVASLKLAEVPGSNTSATTKEIRTLANQQAKQLTEQQRAQLKAPGAQQQLFTSQLAANQSPEAGRTVKLGELAKQRARAEANRQARELAGAKPDEILTKTQERIVKKAEPKLFRAEAIRQQAFAREEAKQAQRVNFIGNVGVDPDEQAAKSRAEIARRRKEEFGKTARKNLTPDQQKRFDDIAKEEKVRLIPQEAAVRRSQEVRVDSSGRIVGSAKTPPGNIVPGVLASKKLSQFSLKQDVADKAKVRTESQLKNQLGDVSQFTSKKELAFVEAKRAEINSATTARLEGEAKRQLTSAYYRLYKQTMAGVPKTELFARAQEAAANALNGLVPAVRDAKGRLIAVSAAANGVAQTATASAPVRAIGAISTFANNAREVVNNVVGRASRGISNFNNSAAGQGIGRLALAGSIAAPIAGQIIGQNAGDVRDTVDSEQAAEKFKDSKKFGGALAGAGIGASIGVALGNPLIAAGGALVGGFIGYTQSLKNAELEIRELKIADAIGKFIIGLNAIKTSGTSASFKSFTDSRDAVKSSLAEVNDRAKADSKGFLFGGVDQELFNQKRESGVRREFTPQLPDIIQALNRQTSDVATAKNNPFQGKDFIVNEKDTDEAKQKKRDGLQAALDQVTNEVANGGNGLNIELIKIVAELRKVSVSDIKVDISKNADAARRQQAVEELNKKTKKGEEKLATDFSSLTLAISQASSAFEKISNEADVLSDIFTGNSRASKVNYGADNLQQFGRSDNGALEPLKLLSQIDRFGGGGLGANQLNQAKVLQDVSKQLAPIIQNAEVQGATNPEALNDLPTTIAQTLRAFGKDQKYSSEDTAFLGQVISGIQDNINSVATKGGPSGLGEKIREGSQAFVKEALQPKIDIIQKGGTDQLNEFTKIANSYIELLTSNQQKIAAINEGYVKLNDLQFAGRRVEEEFKARRDFSDNPLKNIPLEEEQKRFKQKQIFGLGGPQGAGLTELGIDKTQVENPDVLGKALARVNNQIPEAFNKTQKFLPGTDEFKGAADSLSKLKSQSANLQQALKNVADAAGRSAFALEKLGALKADEESRRQLGAKLLGSGQRERQELNRGLALLLRAKQDGNFDKLTPEEFQATQGAISTLGGDTILGGLEGAPTAKQLNDKLINNSLGGIPRQAKPQADERGKLEAEIINNYKQAKTAQEEFLKQQERLQEQFFSKLEQSQERLIAGLIKGLLTKEQEAAQQGANNAESDRSKLIPIAQGRGQLEKLGIDDPARAKAVLPGIKSLSEAKTAQDTLLANQNKSVAEIDANSKNGFAISKEFFDSLKRISIGLDEAELLSGVDLVRGKAKDSLGDSVPENEKPTIVDGVEKTIRSNPLAFAINVAKTSDVERKAPENADKTDLEVQNIALSKVIAKLTKEAFLNSPESKEKRRKSFEEVGKAKGVVSGNAASGNLDLDKVFESLESGAAKFIKLLEDFQAGGKTLDEIDQDIKRLTETFDKAKEKAKILGQQIDGVGTVPVGPPKPPAPLVPKPGDMSKLSGALKEGREKFAVAAQTDKAEDIRKPAAQFELVRKNEQETAAAQGVSPTLDDVAADLLGKLKPEIGNTVTATSEFKNELDGATSSATSFSDALDKLQLAITKIAGFTSSPVAPASKASINETVKPLPPEKSAPSKPPEQQISALQPSGDDELRQRAQAISLGMIGLAAPNLSDDDAADEYGKRSLNDANAKVAAKPNEAPPALQEALRRARENEDRAMGRQEAPVTKTKTPAEQIAEATDIRDKAKEKRYEILDNPSKYTDEDLQKSNSEAIRAGNDLEKLQAAQKPAAIVSPKPQPERRKYRTINDFAFPKPQQSEPLPTPEVPSAPPSKPLSVAEQVTQMARTRAAKQIAKQDQDTLKKIPGITTPFQQSQIDNKAKDTAASADALQKQNAPSRGSPYTPLAQSSKTVPSTKPNKDGSNPAEGLGTYEEQYKYQGKLQTLEGDNLYYKKAAELTNQNPEHPAAKFATLAKKNYEESKLKTEEHKKTGKSNLTDKQYKYFEELDNLERSQDNVAAGIKEHDGNLTKFSQDPSVPPSEIKDEKERAKVGRQHFAEHTEKIKEHKKTRKDYFPSDEQLPTSRGISYSSPARPKDQSPKAAPSAKPNKDGSNPAEGLGTYEEQYEYQDKLNHLEGARIDNERRYKYATEFAKENPEHPDADAGPQKKTYEESKLKAEEHKKSGKSNLTQEQFAHIKARRGLPEVRDHYSNAAKESRERLVKLRQDPKTFPSDIEIEKEQLEKHEKEITRFNKEIIENKKTRKDYFPLEEQDSSGISENKTQSPSLGSPFKTPPQNPDIVLGKNKNFDTKSKFQPYDSVPIPGIGGTQFLPAGTEPLKKTAAPFNPYLSAKKAQFDARTAAVVKAQQEAKLQQKAKSEALIEARKVYQDRLKETGDKVGSRQEAADSYSRSIERAQKDAQDRAAPPAVKESKKDVASTPKTKRDPDRRKKVVPDLFDGTQKIGGEAVKDGNKIGFNPDSGKLEQMDRDAFAGRANPLLRKPFTNTDNNDKTVFLSPNDSPVSSIPSIDGVPLAPGFKLGVDPKTKQFGPVPIGPIKGQPDNSAVKKLANKAGVKIDPPKEFVGPPKPPAPIANPAKATIEPPSVQDPKAAAGVASDLVRAPGFGELVTRKALDQGKYSRNGQNTRLKPQTSQDSQNQSKPSLSAQGAKPSASKPAVDPSKEFSLQQGGLAKVNPKLAAQMAEGNYDTQKRAIKDKAEADELAADEAKKASPLDFNKADGSRTLLGKVVARVAHTISGMVPSLSEGIENFKKAKESDNPILDFASSSGKGFAKKKATIVGNIAGVVGDIGDEFRNEKGDSTGANVRRSIGGFIGKAQDKAQKVVDSTGTQGIVDKYKPSQEKITEDFQKDNAAYSNVLKGDDVLKDTSPKKSAPGAPKTGLGTPRYMDGTLKPPEVPLVANKPFVGPPNPTQSAPGAPKFGLGAPRYMDGTLKPPEVPLVANKPVVAPPATDIQGPPKPPELPKIDEKKTKETEKELKDGVKALGDGIGKGLSKAGDSLKNLQPPKPPEIPAIAPAPIAAPPAVPVAIAPTPIPTSTPEEGVSAPKQLPSWMTPISNETPRSGSNMFGFARDIANFSGSVMDSLNSPSTYEKPGPTQGSMLTPFEDEDPFRRKTSYLADGGLPQFIPRGTDTVPAMLTPDEFVINRASARANLGLLKEINAAKGPVQYREDGGAITASGLPRSGKVPETYAEMLELFKKITGKNAPALIDGNDAKQREEAERRFKELGYQSNASSLQERQLSRRSRSLSGFQRGINDSFLDSRASQLNQQQSRDGRLFSKKKPQQFAEGGVVPGGGLGDTIPALLTPGEFVLSKPAVAHMGIPKLNKINRYAQGGQVGQTAYHAKGETIEPYRGKSLPSSGSDMPTMDFSAFQTSVDKLLSGFNNFSGIVTQLATAFNNFPSTLTINGTQNVNVNFSGAEALSKIQGELSGMIDKQVMQIVSSIMKKQFPDANIQLG